MEGPQGWREGGNGGGREREMKEEKGTSEKGEQGEYLCNDPDLSNMLVVSGVESQSLHAARTHHVIGRLLRPAHYTVDHLQI
jgi:hypothetical protein